MALSFISLFFCAEIVKAQDSTATDESSSGTGSIHIRPAVGFGASWHYGVELSGGIHIGGSTSFPPTDVKVYFTFPRTSLGLTMMTYPFKKMRHVGVGFDIIDEYKSNFNMYSEFFYGGQGSHTLGSPDTYWYIKNFVFSPAVEFSFRVGGRCKIGLKTNLLFGFWSRQNGGWSIWKRYWNEEASFTILLGKNG